MSDYILTFDFNYNIIYLLIIFILLIISAFLSCAETAVTRSSRSRIRYLNKSNFHYNANVVYNLLHHRNRLVGTILIGNNIANIFASSFATVLLINLLGDKGLIIASTMMSIIIIIFTEITPKQYALHYPEKITLAIAPIIRFVSKVLYPFLACVEKISNLIIKLLPKDSTSDFDEDIETEIKGAIDLYQSRGHVKKQQVEIIDNIFAIHKAPLTSILIPLGKTIMLDVDENQDKILQFMTHHTYDNFPVYKNQRNNIIGIISLRNIFRLYVQNKNIDNEQIFNLMREAHFLPEDTTLLQQVTWFKKHKQQMIITVNKNNQPTGIITLQDIMTDVFSIASAKQNPLSQTNQHIQIQSDGSIIVAADTKISDINIICKSQLPEKTLTLAGFIMQQQQNQANKDKKFVYRNLHISVVKSTARKIQKVKIKSLTKSFLDQKNLL